MKRALVTAIALALVVPAAFAAPPAGKGKPEDKLSTGQSAAQNPSKKCKAERTQLGVEAFKSKYGTNPNKANAFGKCVSKLTKSQQAAGEQTEQAEGNAAKQCKAERTQLGVEAFKSKYGTNPNKANAFGKCVSKLAKSKGSTS